MKQALVDMMNEIETNSELLQEYDISMWKEYLEEHRATWKIDLEALKIIPLAEGSKYTRRGLQQMKDVDILLDSDSDEGFFASDTESIEENVVTKARSKSVENIKPPMNVTRVRSHSSGLSGSRTWEYDPNTTYKLSDLSLSDNPLNSPFTGLSPEDSIAMDIGHSNMTAPIPLSSLHSPRDPHLKSGGSINTTNSNLFGVSLTNDYRTKEQLPQYSDRSHMLSSHSIYEKDFSPIVGSPPKTSIINRQEFSPFSCTPYPPTQSCTPFPTQSCTPFPTTQSCTLFPTTQSCTPFPTSQSCLFTNTTSLKIPENSLDQYMKIFHIWDTKDNHSLKVNNGLK
jgi:hypothetical protein